MTTHEITSTKDLRVFFPELARTNKFKRKLDELFATGFTMTLDHAEKPFFAFSNKDKTARFKFRFKANGVTVLHGRAKIVNTCVSKECLKENPDRFRNVSEESTSKSKVGNGPWVEQFAAITQTVRESGWGDIGRGVGMLIEDEFVTTENCGKCGGSGNIPRFAHIANGTCFDCLGVGKWWTLKSEHKIKA